MNNRVNFFQYSATFADREIVPLTGKFAWEEDTNISPFAEHTFKSAVDIELKAQKDQKMKVKVHPPKPTFFRKSPFRVLDEAKTPYAVSEIITIHTQVSYLQVARLQFWWYPLPASKADYARKGQSSRFSNWTRGDSTRGQNDCDYNWRDRHQGILWETLSFIAKHSARNDSCSYQSPSHSGSWVTWSLHSSNTRACFPRRLSWQKMA